ncbi:hypothetical protein BGZ96_004784, partial [Linnemannia gamsii]
GELKDEIKLKKAPEFDDIAADKLTLFHVSLPFSFLEEIQSGINDLTSFSNKIKSYCVEQLHPMDDLFDVFKETPPKKTIHVIVRRPVSVDKRSGDNKRLRADSGLSDSPNPNKRVAIGLDQSELDCSPSASGERPGQSDGYIDGPTYAVLRGKVCNDLRVTCNYMGDERVVLVRKETSFRKLVQRIQEKFQSSQPFRIKFNYGYKDEKVSMVDDEDWVLAQRCFDIELWCFSQPDSIHPSNRIGTGSSQAKEDSTSGVKTRAKEELLEEGNEYLDETAFAVILDRLANDVEVKCYYTDDVRVVLVREDISFRKLVQRIQEKFQSTRPLKLTSERFGGALMVDDEDWLLVQQRS